MKDYKEEITQKTTKTDIIESIGSGTIIQHGKQSNRVYIMKLLKEDLALAISHCNTIALEYGYTKIFAKVPAWATPVMKANGYITEAQIPGFYNNSETAFFLAKFLNSDRLLDIPNDDLAGLTNLLIENPYANKTPDFTCEYSAKVLTEQDVHYITALYKKVFDSYPFPIFEDEYILQTMKEGVVYFGVFASSDVLAAVSSAEIDYKGKNAEMTDFATDSNFRGKSLANYLLQVMEKHLQAIGVPTAYTISRLKEPAITKTFMKSGYLYSGTLLNNTQIAGSIETMNVFYKKIPLL